MSLVRWNPARELTWSSDLSNMQGEINRLFENLFRGEIKERNVRVEFVDSGGRHHRAGQLIRRESGITRGQQG